MAARMNEIVDGLLVVLASITQVNGYEARVVPKVIRRGMMLDTESIELPALLIYEAAVENITGMPNRKSRGDVTISIACISQWPGNIGKAWEQVEELMEAVGLAIARDPKLNGSLDNDGYALVQSSRGQVNGERTNGKAWGLVTVATTHLRNI